MPKVFYHRFNGGYKRGHNKITRLALGHKTKIPETPATIKSEEELKKPEKQVKRKQILHKIGSLGQALDTHIGKTKHTPEELKKKMAMDKQNEAEADRPTNPNHNDDINDNLDNRETQAERDNLAETQIPEELEADVDAGDEIAQEEAVEDKVERQDIEEENGVVADMETEREETLKGDDANIISQIENVVGDMVDYVESNFQRFTNLPNKKQMGVLEKIANQVLDDIIKSSV